MKIFQFTTSDGTVTLKVDMLNTDLNQPCTIMDVKYNITNTGMTSGYTTQQSIINFQRSYPYFASVMDLPTTGAAIKAIATAHNLTLRMFEVSSSVNSGGSSTTVLNSSTTTTTTTAAPTTTTTTTAAPTTTTTTTT